VRTIKLVLDAPKYDGEWFQDEYQTILQLRKRLIDELRKEKGIGKFPWGRVPPSVSPLRLPPY